MQQSPFSPKKKSADNRENPRLPLRPLHKISLQFEKNGTFFKIANISLGGIGLFVENRSFDDKKDLTVHLKIDTKVFDVGLEVVHRGDKIIGCRFREASSELLKSIENYFTTELAALKLNKVESKSDGSVKGKTIYLRGQNNCEILLNESETGSLLHFSIILFGNYIEGDSNGNIWVGEKITSSEIQTPKGVQLFKPVITNEDHFRDSTKRFIYGAAGLSDAQKDNIVGCLENLGVTRVVG